MRRVCRFAAGRLREFVHSRAGNFATLTALTMPVMLMFAAFAVDQGSLYVERRELQALADIGALTAAANMDNVHRAAASTLADNGREHLATAGAALRGRSATDAMIVETGRYSPDPALAVSERFVKGASSPNAVRVELRSIGTRHFAAQFIAAPQISASAIAGFDPRATFSVGSRLVRLDAGVLNALLGALTGSSISLSLMDYEALAKADVGLLGFFDALRADAGIEVATFADLLDTHIRLGQLTSSLASAGSGELQVKSALDRLGRAIGKGGGPQIKVSRLLDPGPGAPTSLGAGSFALAPKIGVLDLLSTAALLSAANGRDQIRFELDKSVLGLTTSVTLAVGEPAQHSPWLRIGRAGDVVRTAQMRLLVELTLDGPGGLLGNALRLPIYLELASAEGKATEISCPTGRPGSLKISIAGRPGVAELRIADPDVAAMADFSRSPALAPGSIVNLPLVKVTGSAVASISNRNSTTLRFDARDIEQLAVKRVSTTGLTQSLTRSLLSSIHLEANLGGLQLVTPAALKAIVANTLATATPAIDAALDKLLATLGIALGEADFRVHGATCGRPVLVQ